MSTNNSNNLSKLSLIFGILAFCTGLFTIAGLFGIPAIWLGILGLKREGDRNKALVGIILAVIGTVTSILMIVLIVLGVGDVDPNQKSIKEVNSANSGAQIETDSIDSAEQARLLAEQKNKERSYWHKVVKVIDGDTVKVLVDGKEESVRVIGINAPEGTNKTECFGKNASDKAKELLKDGWIQLERDESQGDRDKYSRLLRFIWAGNGSDDFGKEMISSGYAYEYTYNNPYKYQKEYKDAQKSAENNDKGLWSPKTCDGKKEGLTQTAPKPVATPKPAPPAPSNSSPAPASNCDPNYTPCVPNVNYDLDCADVGFSVRVIGSDVHRLDRNGDGYGCESY